MAKELCSVAKKAVVEYWNSNKTLIKKFGEISSQKVVAVWQIKAIQNSKIVLGVKDDDSMVFEFTYDGDANVAYLNVYKKHTERIIKL